MAETETLGILDEIQSVVSDKLQVVSYKWLSRNFSVSSNAAKSLLLEFVEKYGNGLEVIYSVSGWLKNNPSTYNIRLVSKHKLSDVKQEFDGNCSIHVYSVQACLPKDPATLWNHEFVQAEDLFKQPLTVDNCLRNNMFCAISNSFVTRNVSGTPLSASAQVKTTGESELSKMNNPHQTSSASLPQQKKVHQLIPNAGVRSSVTAKDVKTESHVKIEQGKGGQFVLDEKKGPQLLPDKKKSQSDKNSSGAGSALASMWGRASTMSKPNLPSEQPNDSRQISAEAQICAREAVEDGSSDEDTKDIKIKRGEGNRKRRVVFDYSDEEDELQDAVNLGSPDPPKKSALAPCKRSAIESSLIFKEEEDKPNIKEVKKANAEVNKTSVEKVSDTRKGRKIESPIPENTSSHAQETDGGKNNNVVDAGNIKRRVLKTRIDERGREVTEVVWEGEEPDTRPGTNSAKIAENNTLNNAIARPPVVRKSPAVGNSAPANQVGKAGNKKGGNKDPKQGNKDPKQGNILSFFKKA